MTKRLKFQEGGETLELALIFPLFWILIMFVFDVGKTLYIMNLLVEATRRGARMAVVCPKDYIDLSGTDRSGFEAMVKKVAVYDELDGDGISSVVARLEDVHFDLKYYSLEGVELDSESVNTSDLFGKDYTKLRDMKFAEVQLNGNYTINSIIPGISYDMHPVFRTIEYAESKGSIPNYPDEPENDPDCNF